MAWWSCGRAGGLLRKGVAAAASAAVDAGASTRTYYTIQAVPREYTGSRVAARERALGRIPAVVLAQGGGDGPEATRKLLLTADNKQIVTLLKRVPFFCSTTFVLQVRAGPGSSALLQSGTVLPIKVHKDAETGHILNLVLAWADKGTELKVDVPVVYQGEEECPGLHKGGYLQKIRTSLKYLCPSEHIPPKVEVDLSKLDVGDRVILQDIEVHPTVKLLSKNETMPICKIMATKPEAPKHTAVSKDIEEAEQP